MSGEADLTPAEGEATPTRDDGASLSSAARTLLDHLRSRVGDGDIYVKSKFLAEELDRSPNEIGAALGELRRADLDLRIEPWAYSNATTWRVTRSGDDPPVTDG